MPEAKSKTGNYKQMPEAKSKTGNYKIVCVEKVGRESEYAVTVNRDGQTVLNVRILATPSSNGYFYEGRPKPQIRIEK